jgi:hypothetical protein
MYRPRVRVSAAGWIMAHAVVLASLAASASGIGGSSRKSAAPERLRSWYVAHGPRDEEERLFGYVADEEAMEPAMTISLRARATGETSDVMVVRRGNSVGWCNIDEQGLVQRRRLYPEEEKALLSLSPKECKALNTLTPQQLRERLNLRGGADSPTASGDNNHEQQEQEEDRTPKRARTTTSAAQENPSRPDLGPAPDSTIGLDAENDTMLEMRYNTATDCDSLEEMYRRVLKHNSSHVPTLQVCFSL